MSRVDTNHSLAELLERQTNLLQFSRSQANRVDQASGTSRSNSHNSTAITTTTILIIISIGTTTTTTIDVGKWVLLIRRLTLVSATFASCGQWEVTRVKERESQSQSARHCSPDSECTHTQCKQLSTDYYCCWGNMCPLPTEKHTCKEWEKESREKGQKWEAIAEGCRLCRQLSFTLCGSKSVSVSVGVSEGAPEHFTTADPNPLFVSDGLTTACWKTNCPQLSDAVDCVTSARTLFIDELCNRYGCCFCCWCCWCALASLNCINCLLSPALLFLFLSSGQMVSGWWVTAVVAVGYRCTMGWGQRHGQRGKAEA